MTTPATVKSWLVEVHSANTTGAVTFADEDAAWEHVDTMRQSAYRYEAIDLCVRDGHRPWQRIRRIKAGAA